LVVGCVVVIVVIYFSYTHLCWFSLLHTFSLIFFLDSSEPKGFLSVPKELLLKILLMCKAETIIAVSLVCKQLDKMGLHKMDEIWSKLALCRFSNELKPNGFLALLKRNKRSLPVWYCMR